MPDGEQKAHPMAFHRAKNLHCTLVEMKISKELSVPIPEYATRVGDELRSSTRLKEGMAACPDRPNTATQASQCGVAIGI